MIKTNKKNASIMVYVFTMMTVFLFFAAFAIDGTIIFTERMKLQNITEMTAVSAASEFNYSTGATSAQKKAKVEKSAENVFNILKQDSLSIAKITAKADGDSKKVLVTTSCVARPFFLAFFGVSGVNLNAEACAKSEEKEVTANYGGVNWLSASAAYLSDILSKDVNFNDTAILLPLGQFHSASYQSNLVNFSLISTNNDHPLSLGPGGFITIRLPAPIVDKTGEDLYIKESGDSIEGYMVFAGIDKNPEKPYVQKDNIGEGIMWKNITCSATPENQDSDGNPGIYSATTDNLGAQEKVYGSAYFNISDSCVGGISMVKYIRIIDDNDESAFVKGVSGKYYKAMMYGESSNATSGADIDIVKVLNFVELIPSSQY